MSDLPPIGTFEVLGNAPAHLWETGEDAPGLPETYVFEHSRVAERLGGGDTPEDRERFAHGHAIMGSFRQGPVGDEIAQITPNVLSGYVKFEPGG